MLCENCYIECERVVYSLLGKAVPMNKLMCQNEGNCDKKLHDILLQLVVKRREERWKNDKPNA